MIRKLTKLLAKSANVGEYNQNNPCQTPKIKACDESETSWLQGPAQQIILILDLPSKTEELGAIVVAKSSRFTLLLVMMEVDMKRCFYMVLSRYTRVFQTFYTMINESMFFKWDIYKFQSFVKYEETVQVSSIQNTANFFHTSENLL